MTTSTTKRAYLTGDTYRFRGAIKDRGWKFNDGQPGRQESWYKDAEWEDEADVIRTIRSYSGIRNRGAFAAEVVDVPAAPVKPQARPVRVSFSEFMDGENEWE